MVLPNLKRTSPISQIRQEIKLTATTANYGVYRWWFVCPNDQCARRVSHYSSSRNRAHPNTGRFCPLTANTYDIKAHSGLQLLLLGGVVVAALHPTSRKALSAGFSSLAAGLKNSAGLFGEVFGELSVRIAAAQLELKTKETVVEGLVPARLSVPQAFAIGSSLNDQTTPKAAFDPNASLQIHKPDRRNSANGRRTRRMSTRSKKTSPRLNSETS